MPKGIYSHLYCTIDKEKEFTPTTHQQETLKKFLESKYRGMLLYHKLGSGKTCTAITIADTMLEKKMVKHIYVLSPGSLRSGWKKEYCGFCGKDSKALSNDYTFITINYAVGKNLPDFDGTLVIIDEVHNLINGAKNRSLHMSMIYDKLRTSNCRILALSGTPIINYIYEFAILGNLLKPGEFPEVRQSGVVDTFAFEKLFNKLEDGTVKAKNPTKIRRLMEGIISYYPGSTKEFVPEIFYMEPIKVQMSEKQEINYWKKDIQEKKSQHPPDETLKVTDPAKYEKLRKLYIQAKKNLLTRRASNFYYPEVDEKLKDLPVSEGGWVDEEALENASLWKLYSPKIVAVLVNIITHIDQKHLLFTYFKKKAGVNIIKTLLDRCGIKSAVFSGDLTDQERQSMLRRFNSDDNIYGEKIRILLVTEAGAEGISVYNVRHMHVLESSDRINKTIQAIGRVARFMSHASLPLEERNVKVWRYWSVASDLPITVKVKIYHPNGDTEEVEKTITNKESIDERLYKKGVVLVREIDSFLDLLKQSSVTYWKEEE